MIESTARDSKAVLVLSLACLLGLTPLPGRSASLGVGSNAPPWQLLDVDGNTIDSTNFLGGVVILNFWADPSCTACATEIPSLVELHTNYVGAGLAVIGMYTGILSTDAKRWMSTYGIDYDVVMATTAVKRNYNVRFIPTTYVIDRQNKIVAMHLGLTSKSTLENEIVPLLSGPPLQIVHAPPNAIISWPSAADANFHLWSTPSLVSPSWEQVTQEVVTVGTNRTVTIRCDGSGQFFRLRN